MVGARCGRGLLMIYALDEKKLFSQWGALLKSIAMKTSGVFFVLYPEQQILCCLKGNVFYD